jgi:peptidoglycan/LPS O-acetylase OafA/YrhL
VLAYSYERRFRLGMAASEFLVARVVRLYPLYFFGLVLGTCVALSPAGTSGIIISELPPLTHSDVAINFGFNLLGLPSPSLLTSAEAPRDFIFVLNIPFWSLFFEFWVANIAFAVLRNSLGWKPLLILIGLCAAGLFISEKIFHTLNTGWKWQVIVPGFARVGFSFFCGVAIARLHAIRPPRLKLPSWIFIVALPILLSLPLNGKIVHLYELTCSLLIFPSLIYWGAVAIERRPWFGAALGDASYALYTIHFPLQALGMWAIYKFSLQPSWEKQLMFVLAVIPLAWILNLADMRVRAMATLWLKG